MTGNGTARWMALGALMGSLACASTTARPADTGTAPSSGTTTTDNGTTGNTTDETGTTSTTGAASDTVTGRQGGAWQDTSSTRTSSDTANTGRRIHTDSASVSAPSNQGEPSQTPQTDSTGQYRYNDSTGASSTARDTTSGTSTTRDTSRTQGP